VEFCTVAIKLCVQRIACRAIAAYAELLAKHTVDDSVHKFTLFPSMSST